MKNKLKMTACLLIGIVIGSNLSNPQTDKVISSTDKTEYHNSQIELYDHMIQNISTMEIYDTAELTPQIMANRNGKIIVEKIVGKVTNYELDGEILNCNAEDGGYTNKDGGNYISYERVDGAKEGDKIVTYYIYNPFTNEQDDVWTRLDFIIDDVEI
jgi:sulfatase maturation enzyme AslB (radical SAM superfamily)